MKGKILLSVLSVFLVLFVCSLFIKRSASAIKTEKHVQIMEQGVPNPTTVEEYKDAIAEYEQRAEDLIAVQEQTGIWYKILASRYLDEEMYAEALQSLEKAVYYYPANQNLFYYIGVSAGFMAKASLDIEADGDKTKRDNYLLLSESGYKRAVELEPDYVKALYGLSVLYVLEMNQPAKSIPLLEHVLAIDKKNEEAMMLLGHAYYLTFNYEDAVAMYDKVIAASASKERKEAASSNKKAVLDAMYE